jgi:hypothetical protein
MPRPKTEDMTSIEDFANAWGVSTKTVQNWVEFTYQAFEILLPSSGPFPDWAVQILSGCAKHVSEKANLYYAETGERRRLKGTEYVKKVRALRQAGHFAEFEQFRNFQKFQPLGESSELEDETLGVLGSMTRQSDVDLNRIKTTIEAREDAEIEELANFIEDSDQRKMSKLVRRLQTGKPTTASVSEAIDVAYTRVPHQTYLESSD